MQEKIPVTRTVPDNVDPVHVYEAEGGMPVFESASPVLMSDGVSLVDPTPVRDAGGPRYLDSLGNAKDAVPVTGLTVNPEPLPGPLDFVEAGRDVFTSYSRSFDLASPNVIFHFACHYTGDPTIQIAHGGEPLTIVRQDRQTARGLLSLVAVGHGLTTEVANLTITATGGTLDGGAGRINEMGTIAAGLTGWKAGENGQAAAPGPLTMTGTQGGVVKGVFVCGLVDGSHSIRVTGAESRFRGYTISGDPIPYNLNPSAGGWVLGDGWSVVGNDLVHTGAQQSIAYFQTPVMITGNQGRRAYIDCTNGTRAWIGNTNSTTSGVGIAAGKAGYICGGAVGDLNTFAVAAAGDVIFRDLMWVDNSLPVSWNFFSAPAVEGEVLTPTLFYKPAWAVTAAEILGVDFVGGA